MANLGSYSKVTVLMHCYLAVGSITMLDLSVYLQRNARINAITILILCVYTIYTRGHLVLWSYITFREHDLNTSSECLCVIIIDMT